MSGAPELNPAFSHPQPDQTVIADDLKLRANVFHGTGARLDLEWRFAVSTRRQININLAATQHALRRPRKLQRGICGYTQRAAVSKLDQHGTASLKNPSSLQHIACFELLDVQKSNALLSHPDIQTRDRSEGVGLTGRLPIQSRGERNENQRCGKRQPSPPTNGSLLGGRLGRAPLVLHPREFVREPPGRVIEDARLRSVRVQPAPAPPPPNRVRRAHSSFHRSLNASRARASSDCAAVVVTPNRAAISSTDRPSPYLASSASE